MPILSASPRLLYLLSHTRTRHTAPAFWFDGDVAIPAPPPRNVYVPRRRTRYQLGHGGVDRISSLPDDMLLHVLERVGCARTAARTGVLSRRWRGLWAHLPALIFRDAAPGPVVAALSRVACRAVSLLDVHVPRQQRRHEARHVSSMLRAAEKISPRDLVLTLPSALKERGGRIGLPCFRRAVSIELDGRFLHLAPPPAGGFPALERLTLTGCDVDVGALVPRCPRLRALSLAKFGHTLKDVTVRSASLEELAVHSDCSLRVDVEAPVLRLLTFSVYSGREPSVSISAPMVEKVSWTTDNSDWSNVGLGHWRLKCLSLQPPEDRDRRGVLADNGEHILSLYIILNAIPAQRTFVQEIEKLPVIHFSILELIIATRGHVLGAIASHLIGIPKVTRRLKVVIQRSKVREVCRVNCPCDEPIKNWRSQAISLNDLQEVEIKGLRGEADEVDFLKLLFRCAPVLKRMILKLQDGVTQSYDGYKKIYNISKTCPRVKCYVYLSSGKQVVYA